MFVYYPHIVAKNFTLIFWSLALTLYVISYISIHQGLLGTSMGASVFGPLTYGSSGTIDDVLRLQPPIASTTAPGDPSELTAADMSLSTLYLHEVHHRLVSVERTYYSSFNYYFINNLLNSSFN